MDRWVMPYRSGFSRWIKTLQKGEEEKGDGLFPHQRFVKRFMANSPYRGILLYHGLGVGKTRSAIAICQGSPPRHKRIVLLPASLKANFERELDAMNDRDVYHFISYNGLTKDRVEATIREHDNFQNSVVVIDEVHNFASFIKNNSDIGVALYKALMSAPNCKVIALSGTPIVSSPIEMAIIANLISGSIARQLSKDDVRMIAEMKRHPRIDYMDGRTYHELPKGFVRDGEFVKGGESGELPFVESTNVELFDLDKFKETFVDGENNRILNPEMFARRIQGRVSHFTASDNGDYPKNNPLKIVELPMAETQYGTYLVQRMREIDNERLGEREDKKKSQDAVSKLFRAYTRAISNFVFPASIKRPYGKSELDVADQQKKDAMISRMIVDLSKEMARRVKNDADGGQAFIVEHSPKIAAITDKIDASPGPALIYSSFSSLEGVAICAAWMEAKGYERLRINKDNVLSTTDDRRPKYMIFDSSERAESEMLLNIYNNQFDKLPAAMQAALEGRSNERGQFVKVLMITKSGAEGISLRNVRQVHLMEPYWDNIRVQQVIGRAVRARSHVDLPLADRTVDSYLYMMKFGDALVRDGTLVDYDHWKTTDQKVKDIADRKLRMNNEFLDIVKATSIEATSIRPSIEDSRLTHHIGPIAEEIADSKLVNDTQRTVFTVVGKRGDKLYCTKGDSNVLYELDGEEGYPIMTSLTTRVFNPNFHQKPEAEEQKLPKQNKNQKAPTWSNNSCYIDSVMYTLSLVGPDIVGDIRPDADINVAREMQTAVRSLDIPKMRELMQRVDANNDWLRAQQEPHEVISLLDRLFELPQTIRTRETVYGSDDENNRKLGSDTRRHTHFATIEIGADEDKELQLTTDVTVEVKDWEFTHRTTVLQHSIDGFAMIHISRNNRGTKSNARITPPRRFGGVELKAVIVHIGSDVNAGHYVSYIRDGVWFLYDDMKTTMERIGEDLPSSALRNCSDFVYS